jgi:mannose-6-phosphate isomerase-like protein (cupin superfamily)
MPIIDDIEERARRNTYFREVVSTGPHCQVVVMSLAPGQDIGEEVHQGVDQIFVFVEGGGDAILDGERTPVAPGRLVHVMAGVRHDIVNTGPKDLRFYTIYAPAQHLPGTVHETKADAEAAERRVEMPIP